MHHTDPATCSDRGARRECPVDAIYSAHDLPPELERFRDINASYFEHTITTLLPRLGAYAAKLNSALDKVRAAMVAASGTSQTPQRPGIPTRPV
jgi:hypothetical protein